MKKKLIHILMIFLVILFIMSGIVFCIALKKIPKISKAGEQKVLLTEIAHLTSDKDGNNPANPQINELMSQFNSVDKYQKKQVWNQFIILTVYMAFSIFFAVIILLYLYKKIIRPFQRLSGYAEEVARGNMEASLPYERTNFFGAFTWAFDHMRTEISATRKREQDAIRENKTIIATLSHDIKTPIASIRAFAEGLEAGIDASYEVRQHYVNVIMKKCDEVTRLTDDLVLHSLSELEKLEIKPEKQEISQSLDTILQDLEYDFLKRKGPFPDCLISFDEKRLAQIIENLLNNARKYAPGGEVILSAQIKNDRYEICVSDNGSGVPPEDLPFLLDKFYRGKNVADQPGSGLGLYIVKYIMEAMGGQIHLQNGDPGLKVTLEFPIGDLGEHELLGE